MQSQLLMTRHISLSSLVFEHITVLFLNDNQCLIDCFNFICRFSNQTDWNENDINDIWTSEGWPFKMLLQGKDWGLRIGHLSPKRVWSLSPKRYIFYITKEKLNPLFWLLPDASKCYFLFQFALGMKPSDITSDITFWPCLTAHTKQWTMHSVPHPQTGHLANSTCLAYLSLLLGKEAYPMKRKLEKTNKQTIWVSSGFWNLLVKVTNLSKNL